MRKLATATAVSLALASGGAFGLGLGDIEVQSSLNQAMDADIPLTSVQPGELNGIIIKLASPAAFQRAGIERTDALDSLQFGVDVTEEGSAIIKVFSTEPVAEPFLSFLLDVEWSSGRIVREYTILLDPPVLLSPSASARNAAADQPARSQGGDSQVVPTPIQRDSDAGFSVDLGELDEADSGDALSLDDALASTPGNGSGELVELDTLGSTPGRQSAPASDSDGEVVSLSDSSIPNSDAITQREAEASSDFSLDGFEVEIAGSTEEMSDDGSSVVSLDDLGATEQAANPPREVTVQSGDTLFEIARDTSPSDVSVQQMMMALLAANESSFINRNINLVKAGSILRVPERSEATRLNQTQALAAVSEQNELWQDYRDSLRSTAGTQIAQNLTSDGDEEDTDAASNDANTVASIDGLSEEAQAILDQARDEVYTRGEELRIVANEEPGNIDASATNDELADTDDASTVGELNRRLQLAREELSASRLRTADLSDQAGELQDTSENLDAMVSLRQNEIARLESQLEQARLAEEGNAGADEGSTEEDGAQGDNASSVDELATNSADAASDAATALAQSASDAADSAQDAVTQAGDEAADSVAEATDAVEDSGENALTEAGQTLAQVEPYSADDDSAQAGAGDEQASQDTAAEPAQSDADSGAWYQGILQNPAYLAVAGVGLLGLLGVAGTLLYRRKRKDDDETMEDFDEAGFDEFGSSTNDSAAVAAGRSDRFDDADTAEAFVSSDLDSDEHDGQSFSETFDDGPDADSDINADFTTDDDDNVIPLPGPKETFGDEPVDKDDTISEADVYIAYGLHGQAEELLTKAIERKPNNPEYNFKLLQTYHAQGNEESFNEAAAIFHQRFGGEANPDWGSIAMMGSDLSPGHPLYGGGMGGPADTEDMADLMDEDDLDSTMTSSHENNEAATNEDFFSSSTEEASVGSVSRNFANFSDADGNDEDDTLLIDESIDPAFAFDESDLEATGDFTEIADEISSELESPQEGNSRDDGGIDFTSIDEVTSAANETLQVDELTVGDNSLDEALNIEELDSLNSTVADLTLDLDQLSDDLELDNADLMNSDLDIPELTAENELLLDSSGVLGDGSDEMETMLDLAKAYIDMGDKDSASSTLSEIVKGGSPEQVTEAETLLSKIS